MHCREKTSPTPALEGWEWSLCHTHILHAGASIRFCRPSFLTCKILVALPLSVWEIDWSHVLCLEQMQIPLFCSQRVYLFYAIVHSKLLHTHLEAADIVCTQCGAVWCSRTIALGSSSSGAVRRAAGSTLDALTIAPCGSCFCGEAHLTAPALSHSTGAPEEHRGTSETLPRAAAPVAPLAKVSLDRDLHSV